MFLTFPVGSGDAIGFSSHHRALLMPPARRADWRNKARASRLLFKREAESHGVTDRQPMAGQETGARDCRLRHSHFKGQMNSIMEKLPW